MRSSWMASLFSVIARRSAARGNSDGNQRHSILVIANLNQHVFGEKFPEAVECIAGVHRSMFSAHGRPRGISHDKGECIEGRNEPAVDLLARTRTCERQAPEPITLREQGFSRSTIPRHQPMDFLIRAVIG